jgi:hypothetical protein
VKRLLSVLLLAGCVPAPRQIILQPVFPVAAGQPVVLWRDAVADTVVDLQIGDTVVTGVPLSAGTCDSCTLIIPRVDVDSAFELTPKPPAGRVAAILAAAAGAFVGVWAWSD